ncbi:MAG: hypothetical protein KJ850_10480 [Gammaproteobacteria bacterium]|nr:hypothetical protein [Gammaproteobacteria bacterium]MBU1625456.1 hypothetical protein [Gammaproteobacteria bacterium]MBU1981716.1 hypothetical protein [Gammaproteobacteria bacterium]
MHKFYFSIKTRDGLPIARLMISGRDQAEAERKLKQMYRHCEIISCESSLHPAVNKGQQAFVDSIHAFLAKQESPSGKYPTL